MMLVVVGVEGGGGSGLYCWRAGGLVGAEETDQRHSCAPWQEVSMIVGSLLPIKGFGVV